MRSILLILFGLVGTVCFGSDLPNLEGRYDFAPQHLELVQKQHRFLMSAQSDEARAYLLKSKDEGYACTARGSFRYQCIRFEKILSEDMQTREELLKKYGSSFYEFLRASSDYYLENDAESFKQFGRLQRSIFEAKVFDHLKLLVFRDLVKIELLDANGRADQYLVIENERSIYRLHRQVQRVRPRFDFILSEEILYLYEVAYASEGEDAIPKAQLL